ncbi:MAG: hypothetical protein PHW82_12600 [Bacteroidales bacterium]|nr:hypothetical protein [Bacteroidales bacterium]
MKSKEFIKNKLNYLHSKFNDVKIRYEYRANTYSHIIEIIPLSFFEKNKEYMILESEIEEEFESKYPNENILFISEGALSEIYNPEYKLGYNELKLYNDATNIDYNVDGFNDNVEIQDSIIYALAA